MRFCPAPLLTAADIAEGLATIVLQPRHPWSDGTTHLVFDPVELLVRLAVLPVRLRSGHPERSRGVIPRPRIDLILHQGVLGPRATWRSLVVGFENTANRGEASCADAPTAEARAQSGRAPPLDVARGALSRVEGRR